MAPAITDIEIVQFAYPVEHVTTDPTGLDLLYHTGSTVERRTYALRIDTDAGVAGEYVGGNPPGAAQIGMVADSLLGRDPFDRERIWHDLKRALRKYDGMGIGPIDIALWDFAGKYHDAPVHQLLGTYRREFPAYVSAYMVSEQGGYDSPEAYADFAEECLDAGYPAFKIHPWSGCGEDLDREIETVHAVGERVGDEMDLMHDPVCGYETFADALAVGRACDREGYYWYEDPFADGSRSQHAHRKLREMLDTPLLLTEMVRGVEPHADFAAADATDFLRADPEWDGGITGAVKIARLAEGFGLDVEYHLAGPAQRHLLAATRNTNYYELGLLHPESPMPHAEPPVYAGGYTDAIDAADDGTFPVPDGPGLGVTYDWDYIEANALDRRVYG